MITLSNLNFSYQTNKKILNNINLEINKGEITFIIGQNGSGKSTLCSLIANILDGNGEIKIDNQDIKKMKNIDLRKKIGIVFQNPNNQVIFDKVIDDLNFVLDNLNIKNKELNIDKSLNLMGITNLKNENPYNMSLGQKQKIAIATILATNPDYLVFDEVTSMIDYKGKKDIYKLLLELKKENKGILFSTNIMEELIYADKIVILKDNTIYKIIDFNTLLDNLNILKEIDLEIPFNLKVFKLLKDKKIEFDKNDEESILLLIRNSL